MRRIPPLAGVIAAALAMAAITTAATSAPARGKPFAWSAPANLNADPLVEARLYPVRTMTIYALLKSGSGSGGAVAASVADLASKHPKDVIVNGGFSSYAPTVPAGLLLANGRVVNPLSRARKKNGDYQLSGILCQHADGRASILTTDAAAQVTGLCRSALQAGPIVLQSGQNATRVSETNLAAHVRTMIGIDARGDAYAIVFTRPVGLYVAAEALLGRLRSRGEGRLPALSDVLNLDGDTSTVLVDQGATIIGDPASPRPSALLLR